MTDTRFHYQAFISYSHADTRWADWLHKSLESYRVPKHLVGQMKEGLKIPARLSPVFRDTAELPTATDLGSVIYQALSDSRCLVVICSPRSAQSRWVNEEILQFKRLGRAGQIFCLIVDGEPSVEAGAEDDCFCPALRSELAEDGTLSNIPTEPIAADMRPQGEGKTNAKIKLIAGIIGVGFDDLKQRELARQHRRMAWIAAASMAGLLVTSALAGFAFYQRNEAEVQRTVAENEAETARQTAEFMIELFEVSDPGEARGRKITAHEVLERGRENIQKRLQDRHEIRGKLLQTMGRVYTGLGLYDTAGELLQDSLLTLAPLNQENEVITTQVALARAKYMAGNYQDALTEYESAVAKIPENAVPWEKYYSDAKNGVASTLVEFDRLEEAETIYRDVLRRDRAAWGDEHLQVGETSAHLGANLLFQEKFDEAEGLLKKTIDIYTVHLDADHPKTGIALGNLATLYYFIGEKDKVRIYLKQAIAPFRRNYGNNHPELASLLNNLGRLELEVNELEQAKIYLSESVSIDRALGRDKHDDLVYSLNNLALAEGALGNDEQAAVLFDEGITLARESNHRLQGPMMAHRVDLRCRLGELDEVANDLEKARLLIAEQYEEGAWWHGQYFSISGECKARLGENEEAERLLVAGLNVLKAAEAEGFFVDRALERLQTFRASQQKSP